MGDLGWTDRAWFQMLNNKLTKSGAFLIGFIHTPDPMLDDKPSHKLTFAGKLTQGQWSVWHNMLYIICIYGFTMLSLASAAEYHGQQLAHDVSGYHQCKHLRQPVPRLE